MTTTKRPLKRHYAWKPDIPDHRDQAFTLQLQPGLVLPGYVNRIGMANPIEDQGQLGSCTGNASTSALEIVTQSDPLSRLMAYYNGRAIEGTTGQDAGCSIRDVIKGLTKSGVCLEAHWPYVVAKFAKKPPPPCYKQAQAIIPKVQSYSRLTSLHDVKTALASGLPVVFGFSVPDYFEGSIVAKTGWVRPPTPEDRMIGGHAVVAVGYEDRARVPFVWVRNSWGPKWGIDGYFQMDAQWFTDPRRLVDDMWVIHPTR